ncbi:MAG: 30S ribosomal protein S12 methylthiotransferase RimO [Selenomonadaceae bacterium]|nr:30S ribosomal protein S12 methylthiotransferase RimO [Selenomonadaceae bacterium]
MDNKKNLKAGIISLGCAKNLVDTEVMLGIMRDNNITITPNPAEADILIINTCAFIASAKEESITTILNFSEYKTEGNCKSLIVAGCLGQRYSKELLNEMPEIDAIIGTSTWHRIIEAINLTLRGERAILIGDKEIIYDSKTPRLRTTPSYTAYVKIAEGCDHKCAFCAIPLIRGKQISRPIEDIVAEVQRLADEGVKEINLIAQDTTNYGRDIYGKPKLADLLRELVKVEKISWIRILYAYPQSFTDELIDLIASEEKICNYIDLPLQHAADSVLKRMHRPDTKKSIETLLNKLREKIPDVAIRSTFMVGYPGETDEEFEILKNFLLEQRLDKVGIFVYSPEEDTAAYEMDGQILEDVAGERYHELMSIQSLISQEINESLVEKEFDVLIEGRDTETAEVVAGRSYREAPEVDGQIYIENDRKSSAGDIVRVKVTAGFAYDVAAEKI